MRHTILLLLMLITTAIDAQNVAIGLHSSSLVYLPFDLRGSQTLDSSRVMIKYNAAYPRNDVKKGKSVAEDVMILMVGKGYQNSILMVWTAWIAEKAMA